MDVFVVNSTNSHTLSGVYSYDLDLKINQVTDKFFEGASLTFLESLSNTSDLSRNLYTNFYVAPQKQFSDIGILEISNPYPKYLSTTIRGVTSVDYVCINTDVISGRNMPSISQDFLFEIVLINDAELYVRKYTPSNGNLYFLTLCATNLVGFTSTFSEATQKFTYLWDNSVLSLFIGGSGVQLNPDTNIFTVYQSLSTNTSVVTGDGCALSVRPIIDLPIDTLRTFYTQYNTEKNNIDHSSIIDDIYTDYLISSVTQNSSGNTIPLEFIPLKTHITPTDSQVADGLFDSNEIVHRRYSNIFTGTNQEGGNPDISLGYKVNSFEIQFPANTVTYFTLPPDIYPYRRLNINNTSLAKGGSVFSTSPIKSDKVFKYRANILTTDYIDEIYGQWACTWLSGGYGTQSPIWVDRYYNPSYISLRDALTASSLSNNKTDNLFDSIITSLSSSNVPFFDKISDLTFEPFTVYAYHRVGSDDVAEYLDNISSMALLTSVEYFVDQKNKDVEYVDGVWNFNNSYNLSNKINHNGSFTVIGNIETSNWDKTIGSHIWGNFIDSGFAIVNSEEYTPFIVVPNGSNICVYNRMFKFLSKFSLKDENNQDITITHITRKQGAANYWVVDSSLNLYEIDLRNIIISKVSSLTNQLTSIDDITCSDVGVYVTSNQGKKYFFDNTTHSQSYTGVTTSITPISSNKVVRGFINPKTSVFTTTSATKLIGHEATIDYKGNVWWIENGRVYKNTDSRQLALTSVSGIESIVSDLSGNIWVYHDKNKLTCIDNDRNILQSLTLDAYTNYSRYIDLICTPYETYPIVLTQAASGSFGYVINSTNTEIISTVPLYQETESSVISSFNTPMSGWNTVTGYSFIRDNFSRNNLLQFKFTVTSIYNFYQTSYFKKTYTLTYPMSSLKMGNHSFACVLDTAQGIGKLFIDANLVDTVTITAVDFTFNYSSFNNSMFGNIPAFYNNISLFDFTSIYDFNRMLSLSGVQIYDYALPDSDISFFNVADSLLTWNAPTRSRNYIENIESFYRNTVPGRKSNKFNLRINNSRVTDTAAQAGLSENIRQVLSTDLPLNTQLSNITWTND